VYVCGKVCANGVLDGVVFSIFYHIQFFCLRRGGGVRILCRMRKMRVAL
jgi:hypothetical protein